MILPMDGTSNHLPKKPMPSQERGCWFDTEGSLDPGIVGRGGSDLVVTQTEREPLLDYMEGARLDGVKCGMYYAKSTRCYFLTVNGLENIAKELTMIMPFVRTRRKWDQIARFRDYLTQKRTRHQHQAKRALAILDSGLKACRADFEGPNRIP
jgi:hypothetical protein